MLQARRGSMYGLKLNHLQGLVVVDDVPAI